MAKKKPAQESIKVKEELTDLQNRWADEKYQGQTYIADVEIVISGSTFADLLNATTSYALAMKDTKKLLTDVYKYYTTLEESIHKLQVKLAEMHCDNVDAGLTKPTVKKEKDGE